MECAGGGELTNNKNEEHINDITDMLLKENEYERTHADFLEGTTLSS